MLKYPLSTGRFLAPLSVAATLLGACSSSGVVSDADPARPVAAAAAPATASAASNLAALERRIAELELRVLEKDAQVRDLQVRLNDARTEVVRAMGRLQSTATRAEAASGIAEAEIALEALPPTATAEGVADARALMDESSAEFNDQNYGGALYLANQAKDAAATARQQLVGAEPGTLRPDEQPFALPLPLQTTGASNVRGGPGVSFEVLYVLPADAPLTGYSAVQQWLKVADDSGRRGWISQSLIRQRP
jgi:uncharacterized coiled-coil protein SlyX